MSWRIHAWLEDGRPRLRIDDSESRLPSLYWAYQGEGTGATGTGDPGCDSHGAEQPSDRHELQRLFRELILLSVRQDAANVRVFRMTPVRG